MTRYRIHLTILFALLAALRLIASPPASAQDPDTIAGNLEIADLDGVQAAVSRTYAADIATLVASADSATPAGISGEPLLMLALVAEFDTPDHAENAANRMQQRLATQFPGDAAPDIITFSTLGDRAWRIIDTRTSRETPLVTTGFVVLQGRWVALSIAVGHGDSTIDAARGLVEFILAHPASPDAATYNVSGSSRGGIWDRLPGDAAVDLLAGTRPIYDNQILSPASITAEG